MASPNGSWTLAGGKKNKPQNPHTISKGKKKALIENMPRIERSRKSTQQYASCCNTNSNPNPHIIDLQQ